MGLRKINFPIDIAVVAIILMLSNGASADMGFFGTIAQNPVPLDFPIHPCIELTAEDVLIEVLPGGTAVLTADFLFTNTGPADTVLMYFPVSVMVPTISVLWSLDEITDPLVADPLVTVNGERVDVRPMLCTTWNRRYEEDGAWETFRSGVEILSSQEEPDSGLVFYLAPPDYWESLDMLETVMSDSLTEDDWNVLCAHSSHALWEVPFAEGEQVVVEYAMEFAMRYQWESHVLSITYPLYTGGSWAGPIGSGRITVTNGPGKDFGDIVGWSSESMPEAELLRPFPYHPLPLISESGPGYGSLWPAFGEELEAALVWEFRDLEPVVSSMGWMYYYEDPSDENALYQVEVMTWPEEPPPWPSVVHIEVIDKAFQPY